MKTISLGGLSALLFLAAACGSPAPAATQSPPAAAA